MSISPYNKIVLKSTTKLSLNDRFSAYRKNAESAASVVGMMRQSMQQIHQQNSKNWRLIQQMENRPSVIAALKIKKRSLKQRLGQPPRTSIKARLSLGSPHRGGRPNVRYMARSRGRANYRLPSSRMRQGGGGGPSGRTSFSSGGGRGNQWSLTSGQVQSRLGSRGSPHQRTARWAGGLRRQGAWNQGRQQMGGVADYRRGGRGGYRGRLSSPGQYRNSPGMLQQQQQAQRRGRGGFTRRGGRGRAGKQPVPTKQTLDNELDEYMSRTKGNLDMELETYMAQAQAE